MCIRDRRRVHGNIPGYVEKIKEVLVQDPVFNTILSQLMHQNESQFFFYLQKMLQYMCNCSISGFSSVSLFKVNKYIMTKVENELFKTIEESGNLSQTEIDNFKTMFSGQKQQFICQNLIEEIGGQTTLIGVTKKLMKFFKETPCIQRRFYQLREEQDLENYITLSLNYLLNEKNQRTYVEKLIEDWQQGDKIPIGNEEIFAVKQGIVEIFSEFDFLNLHAQNTILERIELLRSKIVKNLMFQQFVDKQEQYKELQSNFIYQIKNIKINKIGLLAKSLLFYFNGQIPTRQIIGILNTCFADNISFGIIDQIQNIVEAFITKMIKQPTLYLQAIRHCFYKIQCELGYQQNFRRRFGDARRFIEKLNQYFKNRLILRPLAHGTKSTDLFNMKSIQIMLHFFQEKADCFSYYDIPFIIEQLSCKKKDIFKLWYTAIKNAVMQLNNISKEEAKLIRSKFSQYIYNFVSQ
eukprot:TRINITY_DN7768_c0_g1_i1.p1 TRINITY_DN7768_c0_g1~~TRINITY_DN7768_c0_g1_i1.p1  ORF type:complete len:465 (+),score=74.41 TRINITY_DN7768_c0_g1_i1:188-1582(+)